MTIVPDDYCPACDASPRRIFVTDWAEHHLCGATPEQLAALQALVADTLRLVEQSEAAAKP